MTNCNECNKAVRVSVCVCIHVGGEREESGTEGYCILGWADDLFPSAY
jgi:hypothetical protein